MPLRIFIAPLFVFAFVFEEEVTAVDEDEVIALDGVDLTEGDELGGLKIDGVITGESGCEVNVGMIRDAVDVSMALASLA